MSLYDVARSNSDVTPLQIHGEVTSGLGNAREFLSLSGYVDQFEALFDYTPYPGTLNVAITDPQRPRTLEAYEGTRISEWEREGTTFGGLTCYTCSIGTRDSRTDVAGHVVEPDRGEHDHSELEVVAPEYLRGELDLVDGDGVEVTITEVGRR